MADTTEVEAWIDRIWHIGFNARVAASLARLEGDLTIRRHCRKSPRSPLNPNDIKSARAFLQSIFGKDDTKESTLEKRAHLLELNNGQLGILAVLFTGDDVRKYGLKLFMVLLERVRWIATWSTWPQNQELCDLVQTTRAAQRPGTGAAQLVTAKDQARYGVQDDIERRSRTPPRKPFLFRC